MGKLSAIGMLSLVSGLFMIVFKAISAVTKTNLAFVDLTLRDVLTPDTMDTIDAMSEGVLHTMASTVTSTPLYLGCIILGVLILLIGGALNK